MVDIEALTVADAMPTDAEECDAEQPESQPRDDPCKVCLGATAVVLLVIWAAAFVVGIIVAIPYNVTRDDCFGPQFNRSATVLPNAPSYCNPIDIIFTVAWTIFLIPIYVAKGL